MAVSRCYYLLCGGTNITPAVTHVTILNTYTYKVNIWIIFLYKNSRKKYWIQFSALHRIIFSLIMNFCLVSVWVLKQASYDKSAGFWLSSAMVIGDCRLFVKAAIAPSLARLSRRWAARGLPGPSTATPSPDLRKTDVARTRTGTRAWNEGYPKVREDFTITESAPTRTFSWLKAPTSTFTSKTLLRHYAKQTLTHGK